MAFWPRDERTKKPPLSKRSGLAKEHLRNYPNLEPGLIGAATLLEVKNNRFQWAFVNTPSNKAQDSRTRLNVGKQIDVFPPTRSIPIQYTSSSIQQRAEQGTNFLRTFLPDVEIASELIREQLVEETTLLRDLEKFDPYMGNLLEVFKPLNASNNAFLIFPTGETNQNMNISAVTRPSVSNIMFKPSATPSYTFATPIQQIAANKNAQDINLAVRTYSSLHFFSLEQPPSSSENLLPKSLASFSRADMTGELIVDINYLPSSSGALAVGDGGTIFNCMVGDGRKSVIPIHTRRLSSGISDFEFWRLSTGPDPHTYFVMSSETVWHHDIRTDSVQEFLSFPIGKHLLTSVENHEKDNILHLCSTHQILWMDIRFPNKPLLAYSHGREYDRYLSVQTVNSVSNNPLTFLTTRNNALTTVYDVSRSVEQPVQINVLPYVLSWETSMYQKHLGEQFIFQDNAMGILRLSERGAIQFNEIILSNTDSQLHYTCGTNQDIQNLATAHTDLYADIGPLGRQEFSQVDLHPAYNELFRQHFLDSKKLAEDAVDSVSQLLDHFPSYMQTKEVPIEHMLTTYDIAFRAGDEPGHCNRADFLTEGLINTQRGYRALKQGQFSPQLVKTPWHRSILPVLRRLDRDFPVDSVQSMEYLHTFDLADSESRSTRSRQDEQDACQQLTLDLALSSDIYSETSFSKNHEINQSLEIMTEALSLVGEPPPIEFGYLNPLEKFPVSEGERWGWASAIPELPIGVRLLLKEWDNDPSNYNFQDPYHDALPSKSSQGEKPTVPNVARNFTVKNQRPPQVVASNVAGALPEISRRIVPKIQSQDQFADSGLRKASSFSQDLVSTQVLPGPHGGRPGIKKKAVKKRLGGF